MIHLLVFVFFTLLGMAGIGYLFENFPTFMRVVFWTATGVIGLIAWQLLHS